MFGFIRGFLDALSGFSLIMRPGVKRFVLIPLLVNIALFSLAIRWATVQVDHWVAQLLPSWLGWLEWLIWPLFAVVIFLFVFYSFTTIANLIAAPFNSLLSARLEEQLSGERPIDGNRFSVRLVLRTVRSEVGKIGYALRWLVPLIIITLIPALNLVSPLLWILFAAWFFALEYNDYPLANRGMLGDEVRDHTRRNRMRSLGFGTAVFLFTSFPVINFLAMPVAVAGATKLNAQRADKP